jgi:hypothetical protein
LKSETQPMTLHVDATEQLQTEVDRLLGARTICGTLTGRFGFLSRTVVRVIIAMRWKWRCQHTGIHFGKLKGSSFADNNGGNGCGSNCGSRAGTATTVCGMPGCLEQIVGPGSVVGSLASKGAEIVAASRM